MAGADSSQIRKLTNDIGVVSRGSQPKIKVAVRKTLTDVVSTAQSFIVLLDIIDSGDLLNSVTKQVDPDGMGGEAGPTVDYGIFQETGTSTQPARPYLGPAFDIHEPGFRQALAQIADGLVR